MRSSATGAETCSGACAIDTHEGDELDEPALQDLIRAAVALNSSGKKRK